MRRLVLLIFASMTSLLAPAYSAVQAHATNLACNVATDSLDVVYQDWHNFTTTVVSDSYPGSNPTHTVGIDLWFWRLNHRPDPNVALDHCYRAAYASEWTYDGASAFMNGNIRLWVCGHGPISIAKADGFVSRTDVATRLVNWDQHLAGYQTDTVPKSFTLPSGVFDTMQFGDYGTLFDGCLPQGDTYAMRAASDFWTPSLIVSSPGSQWYCHDRSGDQGPAVYCP